MQQQVLPHERHPQISRQRQHMHGQPWKLLGKASAFSSKCQPGAAKKGYLFCVVGKHATDLE